MKQLVQSILKPFGLRLTRLNAGAKPTYGSDILFSVLKQSSFSPQHIFDIGANHGNWTRSATNFFPAAHYTLVEPQDHLKQHVQDLIDKGFKIRWINAGAWDKSGNSRSRFHIVTTAALLFCKEKNHKGTKTPPCGST